MAPGRALRRTLARTLAPASAGIVTALVTGCAGIPDRNMLDLPGAARPELVAPAGLTLADKAEHFHRDLATIFLSPDGRLLVYRQLTAIPGFHHRNVADQPIWTGAWVGSEALRFLATGDADARENVLSGVRGLNLLLDVTGVRGLLARCAIPRGGPGWPVEIGDSPFHDGAPPYEDWIWRGDVSKDQYTGTLFGLGLACFAFPRDPEILDEVARGAAAIADHFITHEDRIVDVDGRVTTHGDLSLRYGGVVEIGLHAQITLLASRLAELTTGERRFHDAHVRLLEAGAPDIAVGTKFQVFGLTNHSNDNMQYLVNLPLALLEPDPKLRRRYVAALARTWEYVRLEGNPFFTFATAAVMPVEASALDDARSTLRRFPLHKESLRVDLTDDPRFEETFLGSRRGRPKSPYALPISYRAPSSYLWKSDPYELVSGSPAEGRERYSGLDYLLAYWLGRAIGVIGTTNVAQEAAGLRECSDRALWPRRPSVVKA